MNASKTRTLSRKILISCGNHMMTGFDRHRASRSSEEVKSLKESFVQKVDAYLETLGTKLDNDSWKINIPQSNIEIYIHPLDDHISFKHGVERFACGLLLKQEGELCISAIFSPFFQELYFAENGRGLKRNNASVGFVEENLISNSILTLVLPSTSSFEEADIQVMQILASEGSQVQITSSALFTCARVVNGNIAAALFRVTDSNLIDLLGHIIKAAGGTLHMTEINGQPYYIASNHQIGQHIASQLSENFASSVKA